MSWPPKLWSRPQPSSTARYYLAKRQERAAIARAFRLGLRPERAYTVEDWTLYLMADGRATLSSEENTDLLNRRATLEEANELPQPHELRLWPTSEDYFCAVLLGSTQGDGTFLATAYLGDDGQVELLRMDSGATALTRYHWCEEAPDEPPQLICDSDTARAVWACEFRDAPPRFGA